MIIPAYNEELALPAVLANLAPIAGLDVLVVDDGSTDDTAAVARRAGVAVASLPFNLGIGGALRCGFRYAVENNYQCAVQLDADGQHDPEAVNALLDPIARGVDLAVGSRFAADDQTYDVGRVRRSAMGILRVMVRMLTGRTFTDTSSGFRAFSRPMLDYFAVTYPSEYMESVEALMLALNGGFTVEEVPTRMMARAAGEASTLHVKLAYHYLRVMLVVLVQAGRRAPEHPT